MSGEINRETKGEREGERQTQVETETETESLKYRGKIRRYYPGSFQGLFPLVPESQPHAYFGLHKIPCILGI